MNFFFILSAVAPLCEGKVVDGISDEFAERCWRERVCKKIERADMRS